MKKWIIISISIVVIVIGGYFVYRDVSGPKETAFTLIPVLRGEIVENVSVTGTVISAEEIDLQFENKGKIEKIEVKVGDRVKANQVLIMLDTDELNAQLQANQATIEAANAKLSQTLVGARKEDIQVYQTAVKEAEVDVENKKKALADVEANAKNNLNQAYENALDTIKIAYTVTDQALYITFASIRQEYFSGNNQISLEVKEKENTAKDNLSLEKTYLDNAGADPNRNNIDLALDKMNDALNSIRDALAFLRSVLDDPTVKNNIASTDKTSVDKERANINNELVNITSAKQNISSTKAANQTNINTAQSNIDTAETALKKAQDELILREAKPRQADIDLAQAEVKRAQANLLETQIKISKSVLKAPTAGLITNIEKKGGETAIADSTILSMIDVGKFQIEANISEAEITKVNLKDKTEMTLDALGPNEKFTGQIIKIDPAETVVSGVIYYKVTAIFDSDDKRIKSGMTVNIDIKTDQRENALYLPYYAIRETEGKKLVRILQGKEIKEKEIKTGLEGETKVEILEGLKEKEEVLVER